jgi:hypothetical protein
MGKGRKGEPIQGNRHTRGGVDWPTRKTSGKRALGRKEGGGRGDETTRAKKSP